MNNTDLEKLVDGLNGCDAVELIKLLARQHGGEVLDSAIDELIEEGEDLEFPSIIDTE